MASTVPIVHVTQQTDVRQRVDGRHGDVHRQRSFVGAAGLAGRFFLSGDLNIAGSDTGTGLLVAGPPRQVGAVHPLLAGSGLLVEIPTSQWTHYQEATLSTIQNAVSNIPPSVQGFVDGIDPAGVDAAAGAQWDFASIPAAPGSATVSAVWHFTRTSPLDLARPHRRQALGQTATVKVAARNADGSPDPDSRGALRDHRREPGRGSGDDGR